MKIKVLGVMTGTSCDGLDAACLSIDPGGWQLLWTAEAPYPSDLRKRVLAVQEPGSRHSLQELLALDRDLGDWYGKTLARLIKKHPASERPDLIANHGQTVAHFPKAGKKGKTLQLGDASRIVAHTGLSCVSQFRDGDMAAGGQGAPLVPLFHSMLASALDPKGEGVAIHNIGGISNLTYVSPRGQVIAFDTGPGNAWIDAATEATTRGKLKMDRGGRLAKSTELDVRVLSKMLAHPYFAKSPPKSTGRDDFTRAMLLSHWKELGKSSGSSIVATATALTVESIGRAYDRFVLKRGLPLKTVYVFGGGARNPTLMGWLADRLGSLGIAVLPLDAAGFDSRSQEAQAFAFFGFMSLLGRSLGGSWTGADPKFFATPAHILPGKNWNNLLRRLAGARSGK